MLRAICRALVSASFIGIAALPAGAQMPMVIPRPSEVRSEPGQFTLAVQPRIRAAPHAQAGALAEFLAAELAQRAGVKAEVLIAADPAPRAGDIVLALGDAAGGPVAEDYTLNVASEGITLAGEPAGVFRGMQTLLQMIEESAGPGKPVVLPRVTIRDTPRYPHRGMLLDCGRHFWPKEVVKRYIDLLAYHKLNVLHWHLTEDQGWRIEIKKYPKLTQIGAWRKATRETEQPRDAQGRYGGFYTQDDIREIVAYAASRYITVIPEIELPGHSLAALAANPELSCTGGPFDVGTEWGVFDDVYCAGKDETFAFLEDVLTEVCALFPGQYIHIGGDECPKKRWEKCAKCQARIKAVGLKDEHELQSYFIRRVEKFLNSKGKRIIGWDEILEGGLAPNATVQSWRGMEGAIAAATAGHDVISSPTSHCYLDYPQEPNPAAPSWMGLISLQKVYEFEPTPTQFSPEQAAHVRGAEGNMWTERTPTVADIDRMVWPRLAALAEVMWSPKEARNWDDFVTRLHAHFARLEARGVLYHVPMPEFRDVGREFADSTTVTLTLAVTAPPGAAVRYTLDGSDPTPAAAEAPWARTPGAPPLTLRDTATIKAATFLPDGRSSAVAAVPYRKLKPNAPVAAADPVAGLAWTCGEGNWLAGGPGVKPEAIACGVATAIDDSVRVQDNNFSLRFEGAFVAPRAGVYTFHLAADDHARLQVGASDPLTLEARFDGGPASGRVLLEAGTHPLTLEYFQAGGARVLSVEVEGPELSRRPLAGELICVPGSVAEQARQRGAALTALGPTTVRPVPRAGEWWQKRYEELNRRAADERADIVFIGDSITQGWEGEGRQVWAERFAPAQAINLGIGGDRTQHVLWRLKNGHMAGLKGGKKVRRPTSLIAPPPGSPRVFVEETHRGPRLAVLMIGTNNSNGNDNTAEEIAAGIVAIVDTLRAELPETKVLILGIFPRGAKPNPQREKNAAASAIAAKRADGKMVHYLDIGEKFLTADGTLTTEIMPDLLHLSPQGYAIWADAITPELVELLK